MSIPTDRCVTLPTGRKCMPTTYTYLFQAVIPTANGILPNQTQSMDSDGDFWLHSIYGITGSGGNYSIRLQDADKQYRSNDYVPVQAFQTAPVPVGYVFDPPIFFPAGSPLTIDLQDNSNTANNAIKLVIRGTKMLYV